MFFFCSESNNLTGVNILYCRNQWVYYWRDLLWPLCHLSLIVIVQPLSTFRILKINHEKCVKRMSELSSLYSYMRFIFDVQNVRVVYTVYFIEFTLFLRHFKDEHSYQCWTYNDIFNFATVATLTSHSEINKLFHWVK